MLTPTTAKNQLPKLAWIPACAGMTVVHQEWWLGDAAVQAKVVVGDGEEQALRLDDHRHEGDDDVGLRSPPSASG